MSKQIQVFQIRFGPLPLAEMESYDFTSVSRSVGEKIFSKMAHRIFLKLLIKLGCLKGKKLMFK